MLKTFINYIRTKHPEKKIKYAIQLMIISEKKGLRILRRHFQRKIYYLHNCDISSLASIGKNLNIHHPVGIVIGSGAIIGDNVDIYQNVTIGNKCGKFPKLGNNVTVYAGSAIIGGISIGDNTIIGANSTITKDIPANCTVYGNNKIKLSSSNPS